MRCWAWADRPGCNAIHGLKTGAPPRCDLEKERELHHALRGFISSGLVKSAHDCSEGGLAVALAESCISQQIARDTPRLIGAQIDLSGLGRRAFVLTRCFSAKPRAASSFPSPPLDAVKVVERAKILGVGAVRLGTTGGSELVIKRGETECKWALAELHDSWWNSIARAMQ